METVYCFFLFSCSLWILGDDDKKNLIVLRGMLVMRMGLEGSRGESIVGER